MLFSSMLYMYIFFSFFVGICLATAHVHKKPLTGPAFSRTYTVKGTLYIPYAEIREPFYAWYDANSGSSRIDYYGGIYLCV